MSFASECLHMYGLSQQLHLFPAEAMNVNMLEDRQTR